MKFVKIFIRTLTDIPQLLTKLSSTKMPFMTKNYFSGLILHLLILEYRKE